MKRTLALLTFFCAFFCLLQTASAQSVNKPAANKAADYSCSYYDAANNKYYCVETTAACNVAHAFVKESTSTASPTLIVLSLISSSGGCQTFEGSLALPTGNIIVVNVVSCGCGSSLTTHVFFARDFVK